MLAIKARLVAQPARSRITRGRGASAGGGRRVHALVRRRIGYHGTYCWMYSRQPCRPLRSFQKRADFRSRLRHCTIAPSGIGGGATVRPREIAIGARPSRHSQTSLHASSVASTSTSGSKCPFTGMIPTEGETRPGQALRPGSGQAGEPIPVRWTSGAEARLANIPEFVRPMARIGIERFARERGALEVDEKILDAARDFFGM